MNKVGFEFLSNFKHRQTINNALYHNEHVLNWDKISCRKIPLNFGLLFQNLIYIGNLSYLLQLLMLNKAYYLEIKIGLINESHQTFSTLRHFGITIFLTGRGETGDPSVSNMAHCSYQMVLHPIILSYQVASPHIPFYPIVLCPLLPYPIISHHIKPQHIKSPSSLLEALENITITSMIGSCLVPSRFY